MTKIDYKKELAPFYQVKKGEIVFVEVPDMNFLMIDGRGNPNTANEYKQAVEALYALAYAIKFKVKKGSIGIDFGVLPLEGLWWTDDMKEFSIDRKDIWKWTMAIMQPEFINATMVEECREEVRKKKDPPALEKIYFGPYRDGLSAQILHIGPYAEETPTINKLHSFIHDRGFELRGKHREIYLGDPRKSAPDKLRTIIRQPVSKVK